MQVEAKKAFEEYEMYEVMRNGTKVRAKVSNVENLGIVARGKRRFKTVSGELKELPVGDAYIEIAGEGSHLNCCISDNGGA